MDTEITGIIAFAIVTGLMIVIGLPVWLGLRHARFERELGHAEKMRAMELGIASPEEAAGGSSWKPTDICMGVGVWVPITVFGGALAAHFFGPAAPEVWAAAAGVGATGIICGTILMCRLPASAFHNPPRVPVPPSLARKAALDPDAYDTAGQRG
jgi:hypothetical protein